MSNASSSPHRVPKKERERAIYLTKSHIKRALSDYSGLQKRPTSPKNFASPSALQLLPMAESPTSSRCSSTGANTPVTDDQSAFGVESITVLVRTRPLNEQEKLDGEQSEHLFGLLSEYDMIMNSELRRMSSGGSDKLCSHLEIFVYCGIPTWNRTV
jgi:hypothetical protein